MRDKAMDDLLILGILAREGKALNKYELKQRAHTLKTKAERDLGKRLPHPVNWQAISRTVQRLEGHQEIEPVRSVAGRGPAITRFYDLTSLGKERLERIAKTGSESYIDVDKARKIVEGRWTPDARRASQEISIAHDWLTWRLDNLVTGALQQARKYRDMEKIARTVSTIFIPDLTRFMRACYRHREAEVDGIPVYDLEDPLPFNEDYQESCRVWVQKFAPIEFRQYTGKLPNHVIAWAYLFSRSRAQGLRELARIFKATEGLPSGEEGEPSR